jgi:hypothetical protein
MFFDATANLVVGNAGWVDLDSLWTFDPTSHAEKTIAVEGAKYLTLRAGEGGLFRVVHHGSPRQIISIRAFAEPGMMLAAVEMADGKVNFTGDLTLWQHFDPSAIFNAERGQRLIFLHALEQRIIDLDLSWFFNENYDLGYQSLIDCMTIDAKRVIVSIQRSSDLVIMDLDSNVRVGTAPLAGRRGNPLLTKRTSEDFLSSDYDTLCRVDSRSLSVLASQRLQDAGGSNTQQFIGDYDCGWGACVVARPFSSDVVRLDPENLEIEAHTKVDGQPLSVCLISKDQVVTRDWKTGRVAVSEF